MQKIWLSHYPKGVPNTIDETEYHSLVHLLEQSFRHHSERPAFTCMGVTLTYSEIDQLSTQLAAWLQHKGFKKGARIALMLPNVLHYPIAIAAALRAGCVVVNVNPLYTPRELEHQLKDSEAEAIIVLENFAATVQATLKNTRVRNVVIAKIGDFMGWKGPFINFALRHIKKVIPSWSIDKHLSFNDVLSEGLRYSLQTPDLTHDDIAFLQYTGGTTGVAKGAMLTHRNMIANTLQCNAWLSPAWAKPPVVEQMSIVCALPLYHIFSLTICYLLGIKTGSLIILIPNPRDLKTMIEQIRPYRFNIFPAVNTLYNGLIHRTEFTQLDFSALKACIGGGMAVQRSVAEHWMRITGCPIVEGYGLSETSPVVCCNPTDIKEYSGTVGLPLPSTEVEILDEDNNTLPVGQTGEIAVRGPQVMLGYWQRPDETAQIMSRTGFLKTGDVGFMNERGHVTIVDRKKDMITVSGFKVFPNEVEQVINMHPGVLECACIGVPDQNSGEAVKLFVVKKDPTLTVEDLADYCKEQFAAYKRPKLIVFKDELPKSNVGKILRKNLRDE